MAIIQTPTASSLETRVYFATEDQVTATSSTIATNLDCICTPFNRAISMPQFINRNDKTNTDENDFHSFIFELVNGATMTATITNLSTNTTTTIVNNDYGVRYDVGSFPDRPRVWWLKVDWNMVYDEDGYGEYRFNFVIKNAASTTIFNQDSICFQLQPWDCEAASGTVRIEVTQTGQIIGGFDYRDLVPASSKKLSFNQQIRWFGRFSHETPRTEVDYIDSNTYQKRQVQQQVVRNYNLRLDLVRFELSKPLIEDYFMANKILISDYNVGQHEIIRNKRVVMDEISDFANQAFSKDAFFNTKFSDFKQDLLKRNP